MTDMIKEISARICGALATDEDGCFAGGRSNNFCDTGQCHCAEVAARAAVKMLMNLDQAMLDAAYTAEQDYEILDQHDRPTREKRFVYAYRAALQAVLAQHRQDVT